MFPALEIHSQVDLFFRGIIVPRTKHEEFYSWLLRASARDSTTKTDSYMPIKSASNKRDLKHLAAGWRIIMIVLIMKQNEVLFPSRFSFLDVNFPIPHFLK